MGRSLSRRILACPSMRPDAMMQAKEGPSPVEKRESKIKRGLGAASGGGCGCAPADTNCEDK